MRGRGVEVVVHRFLESRTTSSRPRAGPAPRRRSAGACGQPGERRVEVVEPAPRRRRAPGRPGRARVVPAEREADRAAVVDADEQQAQRLEIVRLGHLADGDDVARATSTSSRRRSSACPSASSGARSCRCRTRPRTARSRSRGAGRSGRRRRRGCRTARRGSGAPSPSTRCASPGAPGPHGLSHDGSPGLAAFHSAKSSGLLLLLADLDARARLRDRRCSGRTACRRRRTSAPRSRRRRRPRRPGPSPQAPDDAR